MRLVDPYSTNKSWPVDTVPMHPGGTHWPWHSQAPLCCCSPTETQEELGLDRLLYITHLLVAKWWFRFTQRSIKVSGLLLSCISVLTTSLSSQMEYKSKGIQLLKPVCLCSPASCHINLGSGYREGSCGFPALEQAVFIKDEFPLHVGSPGSALYFWPCVSTPEWSLGNLWAQSCACCRAMRLAPICLGDMLVSWGMVCLWGLGFLWWWFCWALWLLIQHQLPSGWEPVGASPCTLASHHLALVVEKAWNN